MFSYLATKIGKEAKKFRTEAQSNKSRLYFGLVLLNITSFRDLRMADNSDSMQYIISGQLGSMWVYHLQNSTKVNLWYREIFR